MIRNALKMAATALGTGIVLSVAACSATDGVQGPAGPAGENGESGKVGENGPGPSSSVSLVTPSKGLLDREIEVSIGGSATTFEEGATPDFGPGITVSDVVASSPTLITAKIKIARDAEVGPRTVKIGELVAEGAFLVEPSIEVTNAKVAQGSIVQLAIDNNDAKAFDPNAFLLSAGGLVDLGSGAQSPQAATGLLLAPPLAKTGKMQVEVANLGADGKPRISFLSAPDALEVEPRAADPLALDATTEHAINAPLATKLFKLETPAQVNAIVDFRFEVAEGGKALPVAFLFGTGGQADDELGRVLPQQNPYTGEFMPPPYDLRVAVPVVAGAQAADHYVILTDLAGEAGAKTKITATRTTAYLSMEQANPHPPASVQALGALGAKDGRIVKATLDSAAEVDAYAITVDPAKGLQLTATSDPDLEIIVTKDPKVLADPQGTPANARKVITALYPGKKYAAQRILPAPGVSELFVVVRSDVEGVVVTGAYTLGARPLP